MRKLLTWLLVVGLIAGATATGLASDLKPDVITGPDAKIIIIPGGETNFRIEVWTDKRVYRPGEQIRVHFRVNQDAYVTLYDIAADGRVQPIYPNRYERDGLARAGREYIVPGEDYRFIAQGPEGIEHIQAVATKRPVYLDDLWGHPAERLKGRMLEKLHVLGPTQWTSASAWFEIRSGWAWEPERYTVRISAAQEGVQIFLDGAPVGSAPLRLELRPGRHQLVALKPGHYAEVREVYVDSHTERLRWEIDLEQIRQ